MSWTAAHLQRKSGHSRQLAHAIRASRRARGISQESLAAAAGIHRTYMSAIERGKVNVSLEVAARLAQGMGMRLSELARHAETWG
jgi:transcriptional regulator with XRE-family HTH domain